MNVESDLNKPVLPLEGVRVLAMEHYIALPSGTDILSSLGAEVIKLEPLSGEHGRESRPVLQGLDGTGYGSAYIRHSRGKSSIAVDLKRPEGIDLVKKLVAHVDVFAENMRAGVAISLGLGPDDLKAINPDLIYASISGYGNQGGSPYTSWPAFAPAAEAMAGMPFLASGPDGLPQINTFGAIVDLVGGLYAVIGVLAALHGRPRNHAGYQIDISLLDTALSLNERRISLAALGMSTDIARADNNGLVSLFKAADGFFLVAILRSERLGLFSELIGAGNWLNDPRFAKRSEWSQYLETVIRPAVERWSRVMTSQEAASALSQIGVVAAPLLEESKIVVDPHVAARHMLSSVEGFDRPVKIVASPVHIVGLDDNRTKVVPVGHDTNRVMREIGVSEDDVIKLIDEGVVRAES